MSRILSLCLGFLTLTPQLAFATYSDFECLVETEQGEFWARATQEHCANEKEDCIEVNAVEVYLNDELILYAIRPGKEKRYEEPNGSLRLYERLHDSLLVRVFDNSLVHEILRVQYNQKTGISEFIYSPLKVKSSFVDCTLDHSGSEIEIPRRLKNEI